jgi:isopentenyl phosphate kinase
MFIVKIGGSVITDKTKEYFFKEKIMDRLAAEIKKANKKIILVHGAGSFGHILAKKYELNKGFKNEDQLLGFSITHAKVQELNCLVLKSLHDHQLPAVSTPPHAILKLDNHQPYEINQHIFDEYLKKGFTPLTFGDVVIDKALGFSICSGDLLVRILAKYFKPEKIIFVIDEDGLYTDNPKINKNAKFIEKTTINDLTRLTTKSNKHADVTQGMAGKIKHIKKIAEMGIDTVLLNGNIDNRLYDTLVGNETKHTFVQGGIK